MATFSRDDTPTPAPAVALTFEQLKELIEAGKSPGITKDDLALLAPRKPENAQHPGHSVFSHPEGEIAHPKAKLKCKMWIGGGPIEHGTVTPAEIDALNRMTPGAYTITLPDESRVTLEVRGQISPNNVIEKMWIVIPEEFENKNGFGTLRSLVNQFTDANRVQPILV